MRRKLLYVYYKENGQKIITARFATFTELLSWCKRSCSKEKNGYHYNGNKILCSYDLEEAQRK